MKKPNSHTPPMSPRNQPKKMDARRVTTSGGRVVSVGRSIRSAATVSCVRPWPRTSSTNWINAINNPGIPNAQGSMRVSTGQSLAV